MKRNPIPRAYHTGVNIVQIRNRPSAAAVALDADTIVSTVDKVLILNAYHRRVDNIDYWRQAIG
jgi:hypothetical protein